MNLRDRSKPMNALEALIHYSLRASVANKFPPADVRRRVMNRAAEQQRRRPLQLLSLARSFLEWLDQPQAQWEIPLARNSPASLDALFAARVGWLSLYQLIR